MSRNSPNNEKMFQLPVCAKIPPLTARCRNDLKAEWIKPEHSRLNSIRSERLLIRKEGDSISVSYNICDLLVPHQR